ncbi:MAG: hypothetical protein LBT74_06940 [Acidobacteriota bacterium]|jgi:hypothetical protein|nr:hypothetical protein [Acidobacteriota bacterium]
MDGEGEIWRKFLEEGRGFHKTVRGALRRPQVFTPEIVQNIAAMGIEKYFMAFFTRRGMMPQNHTMRDFVEECRAFAPLPDDLEASLLRFDELQSICSIDDFRIAKPLPGDVPKFVDAIDRVAALAEAAVAQ